MASEETIALLAAKAHYDSSFWEFFIFEEKKSLNEKVFKAYEFNLFSHIAILWHSLYHCTKNDFFEIKSYLHRTLSML